jgi:putative ABC transport system permease protein
MRAQLTLPDAVRLGAGGLRARPVRSTLSAVGIAVAVAALVAVLGISASATATLLHQLGAQANLLTVAAGQTFSGVPAPLPDTAEPMIAAIPPVREVTAVASLPSATARRSAAIPAIDTGGITVMATQRTLLHAMSATVLRGRFLDAVADRYPEAVLGFQAAQNLGIALLTPTTTVYLAGHYFAVVGILAPVPIAPELDEAALVTFPVARSMLGLTSGPTRIYLRTDPDQVAAVAAVLPFTTSPAQPEAVSVRRPSDILAARVAARTAFVGLFLALGAVALIVGGVGIANTMVISVLERRSEIGLRRAVGARGRHVAVQFLIEALALATLGGLLGIALGWVATAVADRAAHQPVTMPPTVPLAGLAAALVVGALAGLYPALRAARLAPAAALRALG